MEIQAAIELLKKTIKHSTALDEFRHIDLTLIPANEREQYQEALLVVQKAMREGELSKEDFERSVGIKS